MATWPSGLNGLAKKEKEKGVEGRREGVGGIRLRRVERATTAHAFLGGRTRRCQEDEVDEKYLAKPLDCVVKRCSYAPIGVIPGDVRTRRVLISPISGDPGDLWRPQSELRKLTLIFSTCPRVQTVGGGCWAVGGETSLGLQNHQ